MVKILSAAVFFFYWAAGSRDGKTKDNKKAGGSSINFFSIAGDFYDFRQIT